MLCIKKSSLRDDFWYEYAAGNCCRALLPRAEDQRDAGKNREAGENQQVIAVAFGYLKRQDKGRDAQQEQAERENDHEFAKRIALRSGGCLGHGGRRIVFSHRLLLSTMDESVRRNGL